MYNFNKKQKQKTKYKLLLPADKRLEEVEHISTTKALLWHLLDYTEWILSRSRNMEPFLPFIPALFLLSINKLPVLLLIGLNIVVSVVQVVTVPLAPSSIYDCGIFTAGRHVLLYVSP